MLLFAQFLGISAFILAILAFLSRDDIRLKRFAGFSALTLAIHFLMIGSRAGFVVALISGTRFFLAINNKNQYLPAIFIIIYIVLGIILYQKLSDILPILGGICGTIAAFYLSGIKMRLLFIMTNIFWLMHNVMYFSIGGMLAEIFMIIAHIITIYRIWLNR
ncbi:YgjV family protein [Rickettsiales bacterium]|nr:YgjV family protein [Rickettsiales bacterium]